MSCKNSESNGRGIIFRMKKFAVFDIDGTLIRWQLYHAVANELSKRGAIPKDMADQIKESRMRWKRRESDDSYNIYESTLIELFESSMLNISHKLVDEIIDEVAEEYKDQVYVYTRNLARDLKKRGYVMIVISGSHDEIVSHIAKNYGFDIWVGTKYERKNDSFSGNSFIASQNKKQILEKLIKDHGLTTKDSYGVGDTVNDAPILDMVENPIAFNPNKSLLDIATGKGWKIVIERKNVCYELTKESDGHYICKFLSGN